MRIILTRVPKSTANGWERGRTVDNVPTLEQLLAYINSRARSCIYANDARTVQKPEVPKVEPRSNGKVKQSNSPNRNKRTNAQPHDQSNAKREKHTEPGVRSNKKRSRQGRPADKGQNKAYNGPECKMCTKLHPLYRCDAFRQININKRVQLIYQWNLCRVCLLPYDEGAGRFKGCPRCEGQHNLMNCPNSAAHVNLIQHKSAREQKSPVDGNTSNSLG